jgi:hypothetical protein
MDKLVHVKVPLDKYDDEMWWWCLKNFGIPNENWYYVNGSKKGYYNFDFVSEELAAQFVLTWL